MADDHRHERRFGYETKIRVPSGFNDALDQAARAQFTTKSEYLRRAVRAQLEADGVQLEPLVPA
jgi:hypothetical protein